MADRDATSPGAARPAHPATSGHSQPVDAGKTSGGGNSGHDQTDEAARQSRIRNEGHSRDDKALRDRETPDPLPEQRP